MDPWSQNKTDIAKAVWVRLLGCFGDGLIRKFGSEPPQEWITGIGMLNAGQHERGLRRLVFGWKGGPPSLPDFMRLCRSVGSDEFDEGRPSVPALPAPDSWYGDVWDTAANRYLLGHITKRCSKNPAAYGKPVDPARVSKLVAAKKAWASDMRDIAVEGCVPVTTQQEVWREYMARAEE